MKAQHFVLGFIIAIIIIVLAAMTEKQTTQVIDEIKTTVVR